MKGFEFRWGFAVGVSGGGGARFRLGVFCWKVGCGLRAKRPRKFRGKDGVEMAIEGGEQRKKGL